MIKKIYNLLLREYSPQGWWPLTPEGSLKSKHYQGSPNTEQKQFEIMVGAILTQNTAWTNVEKALYNLNRSKTLSIDSIEKAQKEKLAELIRPSGYYNQKAKKLKFLVEFIKANKNLTNLFSKPHLREILLTVNGVGPETADSIILYAAEKPIFVIDAYTRRIFSRIGYKKESYDEWQTLFMESLEPNINVFKEYHALIVKHAKEHCNTKPKCENCPLIQICNKDL
jgi:endonuclease-3 related protein